MALFTLFVLFMFSLGVYSEKCEEHQFLSRDIKDDKLCTKLNASIEIQGTNKNSSENVCVPFINGNNDTACNEPKHDKKYLRNTLDLQWDDDDNGFSYSLRFNFTKRIDKGNQKWWMDAVELNITQDDDNVTVTRLFNGTMPDFPKLDYTRSFKCNSNTKVELVPEDRKGSNVSMILSNFRVQAFDFNSGGYTNNPYICNSDTSGSKIVPIAVGAALAFLIIVVLIAFVVGRIINRQKNTYEPLN